jgi:hypothetical protein
MAHVPRPTFPAKWRELSAERKKELFPHLLGDVEAVLELADDEARTAQRAEDLRVAGVIADRIRRTDAHLDDLYEQRAACAARLGLLGESQAAIAEKFGVGPMSIAYATGAAIKKR